MSPKYLQEALKRRGFLGEKFFLRVTFVHSFIHSFSSVSYEKSTAPGTVTTIRIAIWGVLFQFSVSSLFFKVTH